MDYKYLGLSVYGLIMYKVNISVALCKESMRIIDKYLKVDGDDVWFKGIKLDNRIDGFYIEYEHDASRNLTFSISEASIKSYFNETNENPIAIIMDSEFKISIFDRRTFIEYIKEREKQNENRI